nr:MAG TPA: hypothetical protein [Caudoviricetes sp.]
MSLPYSSFNFNIKSSELFILLYCKLIENKVLITLLALISGISIPFILSCSLLTVCSI